MEKESIPEVHHTGRSWFALRRIIPQRSGSHFCKPDNIADINRHYKVPCNNIVIEMGSVSRSNKLYEILKWYNDIQGTFPAGSTSYTGLLI